MARTPKAETDTDRYQLYDRLDQLEELLEDMIGFGVTSIAEIEALMEQLNQQIDSLEAGDADP